MTTQDELLLLSDVSKMLGIKPYRITYALDTGLVDQPRLRVARTRVFSNEDVQRLAQHFGIHLDSEPGGEGG